MTGDLLSEKGGSKPQEIKRDPVEYGVFSGIRFEQKPKQQLFRGVGPTVGWSECFAS